MSFITRTAAAKMLAVSVRTFDRIARRGDIPRRPITGRSVRFDSADVEAYALGGKRSRKGSLR